MKKLKIGWSEIDITPDKRASLIGQFAERISEYVEKPITATALAIESDGEQMIMVSVDVNGVSYNLVEAVRQQLSGNPYGIEPMKTIYAAIHTHTAPTFPRPNSTAKLGMFMSYRSLLERELPPDKQYVEQVKTTDDSEVITPDEYFNLLVDRLTKVTIDAWNNRSEGSYSNAFGRAAVGMCRRAVYNDGSAKMWGDTHTAVFEELEGGSDTGLELLYMFDNNKKLTGVVANVACPAQCVQHRHFISPDYWGEVKVLLRERFGEKIYVLGLCSIAGDQCPVDLIRWVEPESDLNDPNIFRNNPPKRKADPSMFDISGMKKTGRRIAREIIDLYEDGLDETKNEAIFEHRVSIFQLPVRRVTPSDVLYAKNVIKEYISNKEGDVDYNDVGNLTGPLGDLMRAEVQERMDTLDTEVHIIRLGNVAFATNPLEPFIKYGNQIKGRSNAEQTFLVQLANGIEGYVPTQKAEQGGHYSGFAASGILGHIGGEQLVRETVKNINIMFEKDDLQ